MNYGTARIDLPSPYVNVVVPIDGDMPPGGFDLVGDDGERVAAQQDLVARYADTETEGSAPQAIQLWGKFSSPPNSVTVEEATVPEPAFVWHPKAREAWGKLQELGEHRNAINGHTVKRLRITWGKQGEVNYVAWATFFSGSPDIRWDCVAHNARPGSPDLQVKDLNWNPLLELSYLHWSATSEPLNVGPYYFPQRGRRIIRSVLTDDFTRSRDVAHDHGFGICTDAWQTVDAFTTLHLRVPKLGGVAASEVKSRAISARTAVSAGTPYPGPNYVNSKTLGLWHPCMSKEGGETGGTWISQAPGVEAVQAGNKDVLTWCYHEQHMAISRHHVGIVERDGEPATLEDYLASGYWRMRSDDGRFDKNGKVEWDGPFGFSAQPPLGIGQCPEQAELDAFEPWDFAHLIRYMRTSITLAWLANDPVSKWLIRQEAEIARMSLDNGRLGADLAYVQQNPGKGIHWSRIQGWQLTAIAEAYALSGDQLRARFTPTISKIEAVLRTAQMENGAVNCDTYSKQAVAPPYFSQYGTMICIQHGLVTNGWYRVCNASGLYWHCQAWKGVKFLLMGSNTLWSAATRPKDISKPIFLTRQLNAAGEPLDSSHPAFDTRPGPALDSEQTRATVGLCGLYALKVNDGQTLAECAVLAHRMLGATPTATLLSMGKNVLDSDAIMLAFCQQAGLP